jgi:hypothetical protein
MVDILYLYLIGFIIFYNWVFNEAYNYTNQQITNDQKISCSPPSHAIVTGLMIASLPAQDAAIRAQRGAAVGVPQTFEGPQRHRGQSLKEQRAQGGRGKYPRRIVGEGVDF